MPLNLQSDGNRLLRHRLLRHASKNCSKYHFLFNIYFRSRTNFNIPPKFSGSEIKVI